MDDISEDGTSLQLVVNAQGITKILKDFDNRYSEISITTNNLNSRLNEIFGDGDGDNPLTALSSRVEELTNELTSANEKIIALEAANGSLNDLNLQKVADKAMSTDDLVSDVQTKVNSCAVSVAESATKIAQFEEIIKQFSSRIEGVEDRVDQLFADQSAVKEQMTLCDENSSETRKMIEDCVDSQNSVSEAVSRTYDKLWADVLNKLSKMSGGFSGDVDTFDDGSGVTLTNANALYNQILKKSEQIDKFLRRATEQLADIQFSMGDRKTTTSFFHMWARETWKSSRQKIGIFSICKALKRCSLGRAMEQFWRACENAKVTEMVTESFQAQIPDVEEIVEGLPITEKLEQLNQSLVELREGLGEYASGEYCEAEGIRILDTCAEERNSLEERIRSELEDIAKTVKEEICERIEAIEQIVPDSITALEQSVGRIDDDLLTKASNSDVQKVVTETLVLFNALKNLDVSKADRRDLDSHCVECQGMRAETLSKIDENGSSFNAMEEAINRRIAIVEGKMTSSQQMFGELGNLVEMLVDKMSETTGDTARRKSNVKRPMSAQISRSSPLKDSNSLPSIFPVGSRAHAAGGWKPKFAGAGTISTANSLIAPQI